jgi:ABC-2 type transport system permease protein
LTRTTFVGALIFVVGLLTGMQVGGNGVDIAALVLLAYLVSLSATLFAAGVAMRLRTMQAGPLMQMPVFLVLFLAPVYVPLPLLSGWVHAVATVNPVTPIIETGRDFISGVHGPILLAYAIGAAMVVLFAWWAARGLRSAEMAGGG